MKNDDEIIQDLVKGGLIGATLGAMISKNNQKEGALLGAIAGAAALATYKANQRALKTNGSVLVGKGDSIFEVHPDGSQIFVKHFNKSKKTIPTRFKMK